MPEVKASNASGRYSGQTVPLDSQRTSLDSLPWVCVLGPAIPLCSPGTLPQHPKTSALHRHLASFDSSRVGRRCLGCYCASQGEAGSSCDTTAALQGHSCGALGDGADEVRLPSPQLGRKR